MTNHQHVSVLTNTVALEVDIHPTEIEENERTNDGDEIHYQGRNHIFTDKPRTVNDATDGSKHADGGRHAFEAWPVFDGDVVCFQNSKHSIRALLHW